MSSTKGRWLRSFISAHTLYLEFLFVIKLDSYLDNARVQPNVFISSGRELISVKVLFLSRQKIGSSKALPTHICHSFYCSNIKTLQLPNFGSYGVLTWKRCTFTKFFYEISEKGDWSTPTIELRGGLVRTPLCQLLLTRENRNFSSLKKSTPAALVVSFSPKQGQQFSKTYI